MEQVVAKIGDDTNLLGRKIGNVGLKNKFPSRPDDNDAEAIKLPGTLATRGSARFDDGDAAGELAETVQRVEPPARWQVFHAPG